MFHVIAGALLGAAVGAASTVIVSKLRGQPVSWKSVAAAAAGGFVGGAVTAATFGAGGAAAATASRALTGYVAGGASGSGTQRVVSNLLEERRAFDDVPVALLSGAATGAVARSISLKAEPLIEKAVSVVPRVVSAVTARATPEAVEGVLLTSPATAAHEATRIGTNTLARAGAGYVSGAATGATSKAVHNAIKDRPLGEGLTEAASVGGATAAVGAPVRLVAEPVVGLTGALRGVTPAK
jgi:hypothetical protein